MDMRAKQTSIGDETLVFVVFVAPAIGRATPSGAELIGQSVTRPSAGIGFYRRRRYL
jgi:hypothetical protein